MAVISAGVLLTVGAIVGLVTLALSIATNASIDGLKATYGKEINMVAKKLTPMINKNTELRNQISNALQDRNNKLASDLLMSSPLSSIVTKLRKNIETNEKGIEDSEKHFKEQEEKAQKLSDTLDKQSQALGGSIVSAGQAASYWDKEGRKEADKISKELASEQDRVQKELQAAKKKSQNLASQSVPQMNASQPGSGSNIGSMDRKTSGFKPEININGRKS